MRIENKQTNAHVVSWLVYKGDIPEGLCVCHICDNRKCTNPEHLFLGTHQDNTIDMVTKGRGQHGSKHHEAKLNEEKVKEIKKLLSLGVSCSRIAKDYSVSPGCIWFIKTSKNWKHVT